MTKQRDEIHQVEGMLKGSFLTPSGIMMSVARHRSFTPSGIMTSVARKKCYFSDCNITLLNEALFYNIYSIKQLKKQMYF